MKRRPTPAVTAWGPALPWKIPSAAAMPAGCTHTEFESTHPVSIQFDCYLTGFGHAEGGATALEAALGDSPRVELDFRREPANEHDRNALVVFCRNIIGATPTTVGHVAGTYASVLSPLLDAGLVRVWLQARRADVAAALVSPRAPMRLVGYARLMSQAAVASFHGAATVATGLDLPPGEAPPEALISALKQLHSCCFRELALPARPALGVATPTAPMATEQQGGNRSGGPLRAAIGGSNVFPPSQRREGFVSARALTTAGNGFESASSKPVSGPLKTVLDGAPSHLTPQLETVAAAPVAVSLFAASNRAVKKSKLGGTALQSAAFGRGGGQLTLTGLSFTARQAPFCGATGTALLGELIDALPTSVLQRVFSAPGVSLTDLICSCRAVCRRWRDAVDAACSPARVHWVRAGLSTSAPDTSEAAGLRDYSEATSCYAVPRSLTGLLDAMAFQALPSHIAHDVWHAALPSVDIVALEALDWPSIASAASHPSGEGEARCKGDFARLVRADAAALPMLAVSLLILSSPLRAAVIDGLFRASSGRLALSSPVSDLQPGLISDALYRLVCTLHDPKWALVHLPLHVKQGLLTDTERDRGDLNAAALAPGSTLLHRWYCTARRPPVSRAALDILAALRSYENPCVPAFVQRSRGSLVVTGTAATGPRGCIFTEEQLAVIAAEPGASGVCKVIAFAGTGKTTTLAAYARARPSRRFLYLVFNVSIREEAAHKFPPNVEVTNVHRLAFSAAGWKYGKAGALRPALSAPDAMRLLGLDAAGTADPHVIAAAVVQTLEAYCTSADSAIGVKHLPAFVSECSDYSTPAAGRTEPQAAEAVVLAHAERLWGLMRSSCNAEAGGASSGAFMTHSGYLKLYQLSRPDLAAKFDVLLCDEAQDLAPVALALVAAQRCPVILVGDPHQAIYGFLGAQDALASRQVLELRRSALGGAPGASPPPSVQTLRLTRSFRFGAEIAAAASILLRQLKDCSDPVLGRVTSGDAGLAASAAAGAAVPEPPVVLLPLAPSADPRGGDETAAASPPHFAAEVEAFERRSPLCRTYGRSRGTAATAGATAEAPRPSTIALLARSNAGALEAASSLAQRGVRIAFIGGADGYGLDDLLDLAHLIAGDPGARRHIKSALVRSFASADELRAFTERTRDAELGGRLRMVDRWGGPQATLEHIDAIRAACAAAPSSLLISTVHKAKGLEFDEVQLLGDFPLLLPEFVAAGGRLCGAAAAEAHLLYVAVTRARVRVWLNAAATHVLVNCGGWIDAPLLMPLSVLGGSLGQRSGAVT